MKFPGLKPDDIYLPAEGVDPRRWAVVACDQYTSQPDYWRRVEAYVGARPSTLHIVQPEIDLERAGARIPAIHRAMREYLSNGTLVRAVRNGFTLTERTTASGARLGLVAAVDLEEYDFTPGSGAMIRATEGTIRERIPPRLRIREGAQLECPHVMMLLDDPARTVIEPLHARLRENAPLCDFELMENGGHLRVWGVEGDALAPVSDALSALWEKSDGFLYAVGDGNHSLATAKARWEALKPTLSPEEAQTHPARYALAEIVNLHSPALAFEPIHRVLFGADMEDLIHSYRACLADRGMKLTAAEPLSSRACGAEPAEPCSSRASGTESAEKSSSACGMISTDEAELTFVSGNARVSYRVENPENPLPVAVLQPFLDEYLRGHPAARIDYVHGAAAVESLCQTPHTTGILLPAIDKSALFPAVRQGGALPRKTFSMGEADEKRYYMECRKIL